MAGYTRLPGFLSLVLRPASVSQATPAAAFSALPVSRRPTTADERYQAGPIEREGITGFLDQVRKEAQLNPNDNSGEEAIRAVFGALKAELPEDEVVRIREVLPTGVKPMWAGA